MRSTAWLVLLVTAASLSGCASNKPLAACPAAVNIELDIGPSSVAYTNKLTDPVPGFKRGCPFTIETNWLAGTVDTQWLELGSFVAVNYKAAAEKWQDPEKRKINGTDDSIKLDNSKTLWGPYTLPSTKKVGPPRLILFSMKLKTANGTEVSLDPPWSEKKRG